VVAPFAGIVTARYARAPRLVVAGDTLVRITELSPLLARVRVPERSAASVRLGDAALVVTAEGGSVPARIERLAPAFDPASGTREAVLRVDGAPALLLPGASVQVRLGRVQRRVVVIPRTAVGPDGYVLVVDHDRTTLRAVTLGEDVGDGRVEVVSGLAAGERIARSGR
jgi:RND family efflux transporter MFP subunit